MPYADRDKQREAQREWQRRKYQEDAAFREKEAERKRKWSKLSPKEKARAKRQYDPKRRTREVVVKLTEVEYETLMKEARKLKTYVPNLLREKGLEGLGD